MKTIRMKLCYIGLITLWVWIITGCGGTGTAEQNDDNTIADSTAQNDSSSVENDTTEANLDYIPVEVAEVHAGEIASYLLLSSTVETENIVDVYPLVGGIIEKIFVEEGMYVKEGQILLQLEDDEIALNEAQAQVDLEQQEAAYARLEKMYELYGKQMVADEDFERATFSLKQAKVTRDRAKLTRERTTIRSPISGVIAARLVYTGNLVGLNTKLFVITDPTEKICRVWVPERDLPLMKVGQKAFVSSEISLNERFPGWIKRISPVVDPATGTCKVTIGIRDGKNRLRNGMFVRSEIIIDVHKNTVLVPKNALVYENDREWVYMVKDTLAVKRQVEIGFANGNRFEALSGVDIGDQVVVVGQSTLKDSIGVRIVSLDSALTVALAGEQTEDEK